MKGAERALGRRHWVVPVLLLALGTVTVWAGGLDLLVAGWFYDPAGLRNWPLAQEPLWWALYRWGESPAVALWVLGCLLIAGSALRRPARLDRSGFILLVALLLGPLLVTNVILKGYYGRPRPRQVTEFGGERQYRPVLVPSFRRDENSFPSGHAAAGFAMLLPYFALRCSSPRWALVVLVGGLAYGGLMSAGRIVQGGHFLSDVMWSAGVVYLCGYAAARWQEARESTVHRTPATQWGACRRYAVCGVALLGAVLIGTAYLVRLFRYL